VPADYNDGGVIIDIGSLSWLVCAPATIAATPFHLGPWLLPVIPFGVGLASRSVTIFEQSTQIISEEKAPDEEKVIQSQIIWTKSAASGDR